MEYRLSESIPYDDAERLWQETETQDVFNHPGCWRALLESGVHPGELVCIEVRDGRGKLQAAWPFIIKRGGAKDLYAKIVEPLGAHYLDYIAPLVNKKGTEQVLTCLMDGLAGLFHEYEKLRLPKLISSASYTRACRRLDGSAKFSICYELNSPQLRFGPTYKETEAFWGKSHRPVVRRKLRYMEREGDVVLWITQRRAEVKERLSVLFDLHRSKWGAQGEISQFDRKADRDAFRLMTEYLPWRHLHYSEVRLNGHAVSCHFGFLHEGWLYWYKPAIDREFFKLSPGLVHVALLVKYGIEHGLTGLDFLQGDEEYKSRWSNDSRKCETHKLAGMSGAPWWMWETKMREYCRRYFLTFSASVRRVYGKT